MGRITISINGADESIDQDLLTLDVPLDLTVADLKAMVEADTSLPAQKQHFYLNGQALRDDKQTLEQAGVKDGEMLAMMVSRRSAQGQAQPSGSTRQTNANTAAPSTPEHIEATRRRLVADPQAVSHLIQQQPDLAQALHDPKKFRDLWEEKQRQLEQMQQSRNDEIAALNDDPYNAEAQKRIQEIIRREAIENNLQYAYENNPAVFAQVAMLYVDVKVNNHPIKAFVDSGAQSTIMSPSCAEACGIAHLIDERYSGLARGVGVAKILGRVHNAKIQIGDAELDCAFTVMEGKDVDLLFGLDMLKRHQACIDLMGNKLKFPHTEVQFLGESEIPRRWEKELMDEPVVQGPDGTEIGAKTGTVRPAGSSAQAAKDLRENANMTPRPATTGTSGSGSAASSAAAQAAQPETRWSETDISQLVQLGFSRQEAISALDATGGNVDYAAGLLFQA